MSRIFALIPAAGRSRRMQTHKLLLPLGNETVIERLLRTLAPAIDHTFLLVREQDGPLNSLLAGKTSVSVISTADDPPEMRDSVELLLREVASRANPGPHDGWLLSPADHPIIVPKVLSELVRGFVTRPEAVHLPQNGGRAGHPVVFPWRLAARVPELAPGSGLNSLRRLPGVETITHEVDEPSIFWDLDTPDDYHQLLHLLENDAS